MPGLVISIGGRLDGSFNAALNQAVRAQATANAQMRKSIAASGVSAEEKRAAYAKLDIDDEINRKIINNDTVRRGIRLQRAKEEMSAMNGSGGFGWTTAGSTAGKGFLKGFASQFAMSSSGMAQIISVVSNTASSIGAGMSPGRIIAQQLPNLIQAFTLMGKNAMLAAVSGLGIALPAIGATIIGGYSRSAAKAADESNTSNLNLSSQTSKLAGRTDDVIDNLVKGKMLTEAQAENYKKMMQSHEGLLRVQKELLPLQQQMNAKQEANAASVADSVERSTKARAALETIEQSNWTRSQIRNDLAAREKGLKNLKDNMAKVNPSSPEGQRMQAKLDEENLAIAQDKQRLKSGGAPARMITERERIGLGASSSIQTSMLEQLKKQNTTQNQQLTALQKMVTQLEEGL